MFDLQAPYSPTGDQPKAIEFLTDGLLNNKKHQVLLGVTGSGKSLTYDQSVLVNKPSQEKQPVTEKVPIGPLIDTLIEKYGYQEQNDTQILDASTAGLLLQTISWDPLTGTTSYKNITQFSRHLSPDTLYSVKTSCGREVTITDSHNLWVLRNGNLQLLETADVMIGDYLPLPTFIPQPSKPLYSIDVTKYLNSKLYCNILDVLGMYEHIDVIAVIGKSKFKQAVEEGEGVLFSSVRPLLSSSMASVPIHLKHGHECLSHEIITTELLQFIGLYIAEGHSTFYLLLSVHELELKNKLYGILDKLSLSYKERTYNPGDITVYNKLWADFIGNLCGHNSYEKKLPEWCFQLDNSQLGILLSAYYSGDGGVQHGEVVTVTASKALASDLMYVLLRFGIVARMSEKRKRASKDADYGLYYEIRISGQKDLETFAKHIGFMLERKQIRLEKELGKSYNTNVDIIPINGECLRNFRVAAGLTMRALAKKAGVSRPLISFIEANKRKPSRNTYKKIVNALNLNYSPDASLFINTYWSPITKLSQVKSNYKYVYDFSVADNETFLGGFGGVFVHNTYTAANLINNVQKPTLILSHNKTLAAQLYQEFKDFFPNNAVEYFVSYYDYYQPESYMPSTDTYIEKDADINEQIDKLRLAATTSLLTRNDVIIVSSVSCIYNLGSPAEYSKWALELKTGMRIRMRDLLKRLSQIYYERSDMDFKRGTYRVNGDIVDVRLAYADYAVRLELMNEYLIDITFFDPVSGEDINFGGLPSERRGSAARSYTQDQKDFAEHRAKEGNVVEIFPAKHYVAPQERMESGIAQIEQDLENRVKLLQDSGKNIEAYRLQQRTNYDLEMIKEIGYCKGIENYSIYFDGRNSGDSPYTLIDFFPKDYLLIIDESHITIPQVRGMHNGDKARKQTLIDYGFRLPSALDNRPLNFEEFLLKQGQTIYTSATPTDWELSMSEGAIAEQLIRPTGIIDPQVTVLPTKNQVQDLLAKIQERIARNERILVTTLTKRMSEELSTFLLEKGIKVTYLHSDIDTLERTNILDDLRRGNYDVLVGINLLREGLDLPEVSLVAILDADKEGFLRSESALIQTMGRAARHILGEVIMYADKMTGSMERAIAEVERRRIIQSDYNTTHGLQPIQITKPLREKLIDEEIENALSSKKRSKLLEDEVDYIQLPPRELKKEIKKLEEIMKYEAEMLNFEKAASLRDKIRDIKKTIS